MLYDAWCRTVRSDWSDHLGTIEFAHATLVSKSIQLSPFEIDTGRKGNNAITGESSSAAMKIGLTEYAKKFADRRQKIIEFARTNLENAQKKQKEYYDRKRSSVTFKAEGMVMLDARHLNLRHRNNGQDTTNAKLVAKKIGPFKIKRMVNQNVAKLTIPRAFINLQLSFNIDLLSHFVPTLCGLAVDRYRKQYQ